MRGDNSANRHSTDGSSSVLAFGHSDTCRFVHPLNFIVPPKFLQSHTHPTSIPSGRRYYAPNASILGLPHAYIYLRDTVIMLPCCIIVPLSPGLFPDICFRSSLLCQPDVRTYALRCIFQSINCLREHCRNAGSRRYQAQIYTGVFYH